MLRPALAAMVERFSEIPNLDYRIESRLLQSDRFPARHSLVNWAAASIRKRKPIPLNRESARQLFAATSASSSTITKELVWSDTGKLELKEGTSQVWIDPNAPIVGFPRLDIVRVIQLNGLLTLLNGVVDRQVMKQLTGETARSDAGRAKGQGEVAVFTLTEITAYPLHGDGKELYIPLVVGLVSSNKKTDGVVQIETKTGTPPEPKLRGQIIFKADGKPDVKLDPVK